jgi:hypothetical protein
MKAQQARNVVALLQKEPLYYRNFGIWWWHIKKALKLQGFTKDQLQHLGTYADPTADPYYEGKTAEQLENEAFLHQFNHTFASYNNNQSHTPDGEVYVVLDNDVE